MSVPVFMRVFNFNFKRMNIPRPKLKTGKLKFHKLSINLRCISGFYSGKEQRGLNKKSSFNYNYPLINEGGGGSKPQQIFVLASATHHYYYIPLLTPYCLPSDTLLSTFTLSLVHFSCSLLPQPLHSL